MFFKSFFKRRKPAALILMSIFLVTGFSAFSQHNQIMNGNFEVKFEPWWTSGNIPYSLPDGVVEGKVPGGTVNPWDALIGLDLINLTEGEDYTVNFDIRADREVTINVVIQVDREPWTSFFFKTLTLSTTMQSYSFDFTSSATIPDAKCMFQLGGIEEPYTLYLDNISLIGGSPVVYVPDTGPAVRVNQEGYVPGKPKKASFVSEETGPFAWTLKNAEGFGVTTGFTTLFGYDPLAGDTVHFIDFSEYDETGEDYILEVNGIKSYPFTIGHTIYSQLKKDALHYFYHNRSGIEIEAQYVGTEHARPAGHIATSPHGGDTNVQTASDCPGDYALDVSGGWYDAGDQGKYVVNGGISVWKLMNLYERSLYLYGSQGSAFEDGTLPIPEQNNNVSDLLDEVRWELEFFLKMQVPQGEEKAGMVHHKVHDLGWTGVPTIPHLDPKVRTLRPPSTAATLNLAGACAQAARIWKEIDPAFSTRCLEAAKKAWKAALANPADFIPPDDTDGGGAYYDDCADDEFYWAAAELYITTSKAEYLEFIKSSPHYLAQNTAPIGFMWQNLAPAADLSLTLVPNNLPCDTKKAIGKTIMNGADEMILNIASQGYPNPFKPEDYQWGSNNDYMNDLIIMGSAYDISGDQKYLDNIFIGIDYLFGRNALNQSYVSGYGEKASENLHHRHWAYQADPTLPKAPAGSVAGGPNVAFQDPLAAKLLEGLPPQKCYLDDIYSYSTNEVCINWNSALTWLAAYLDEKSAPAVKGDIDRDGSISVLDALIIAKYEAGSLPSPDPASADVNNDGTINLIDALIIIRYSMGFPTYYLP